MIRVGMIRGVVLVGAVAALLAGGLAAARPAARPPVAHAAQDCAGDRTPRAPGNPLDLPAAPGPNPLRGASFFVNGPAHGVAAGAIVSLLGRSPSSYPDSYSWARLQSDLARGALHRRLMRHRRLAHRVAELGKIAAQPEAQRFSLYAHGGTPEGTAAQVNKIFCGNLAADRGTIPIITTYYAHPLARSCSRGAVAGVMPRFRRYIEALAAATGDHRAVFLLELDALGTSACYARGGSLAQWDALLRYEVDVIGRLPHTVVYIEGGYSDANPASYTARQLRAIARDHVPGFRGFYTNDTHENWTIDEVHWAERVSRGSGGLHYIVNTSDNGHGPKRNRNRARYGNTDLCNPPGRGLGPRDTTATGFRHADAFLWEHVPGNSSGHCPGGAPSSGGPPSGTFWPARAIYLAERANGRLGPHYPSRPY